MTNILVMIPCGATKRTHATTVADMYVSSTFTMALDAARSIVRVYGAGDEAIRVVSAKHGLVRLDEVIEPYDTTIGDADAVTPTAIRAQAIDDGLDKVVSPIMMLPKRYRNVVEASGAWDVDNLVDGYVGGVDCEGVGRMRGIARMTVENEAQRRRIAERNGWTVAA